MGDRPSGLVFMFRVVHPAHMMVRASAIVEQQRCATWRVGVLGVQEAAVGAAARGAGCRGPGAGPAAGAGAGGQAAHRSTAGDAPGAPLPTPGIDTDPSLPALECCSIVLRVKVAGIRPTHAVGFAHTLTDQAHFTIILE